MFIKSYWSLNIRVEKCLGCFSSEVGLLGYCTGSCGSKLDAESEKFSATLGQVIFFHLFGRRMKEWREGREERRADKGGGAP